uniref:uncharacterized protein LOC122594744 n=1 Tax=Erigeron canadensis TaxID=72917 RepID=UPI001CB8BBC5|nr:uncharacterized protein LOC122594744 [Erigeron canadensis]
MRPDLFPTGDDDEELFGMMAECVDLLEQGESSRPYIPRSVVERDRYGANERLMAAYFNENPKYSLKSFRRRFRMSKPMFMRIVNDIISYPSRNPGAMPLHFKKMQDKQLDARGKPGFSTIQKCVCAIRQLAYGYNPDLLDEYLQMGEETSRPTPEDIQRLYAQHKELHGLPGMLGSIDCMHWPWKNCPKAWQGQFTCGDHGHPTIMLEAVASYDRWIWHAFFGTAGSNNDINVLNQSPLFRKIIEDRAPDSSFTVNGTHYKKGYYLADDIYPEWSTFVKAYSCPQDEKRKKFKKFQESARKDVELAFGGLQNSWHILTQPARSKSVNRITRTMYACVILHNMKVEDAGYTISSLEEGDDIDPVVLPERTFQERIALHQRTGKELRDRTVHHALRHDLTEHV